MKIYQIHECSGEYEDYSDNIIGTYLFKEVAEKEMNRLIEIKKAKQEQANRCNNCSIFDENVTEYDIKKYCTNYEFKSNVFNGHRDCKNFILLWNDNMYKIKEETVICDVEDEGVNQIIDEFNKIGCTSFNIKYLSDEDKNKDKIIKNVMTIE